MNYLGNDFLEDYNWSNDFRPNDSFNDLSDRPDPYPAPLSIDLAYFANKFPLHNKPEITTGDGLEIFGVLFDSHEQLSEQIDILEPAPPIQEKKVDSVAPCPSVSARRTHQIDISNSTLCDRIRTQKGQRFETKNLCKHLHTETGNFLKKWALIKRPSKEEMEAVREFCGGSISIDTFKVLFKTSKFSALCRNYYQSKYFVQEIMTSKMDMKTKIVFLKYLGKACSLTYDKDFKSWKDKELP